MSTAVIGSGISGLAASYIFAPKVLYSDENRLGGHSRTIDVDGVAVDTGFIVFNFQNYPHLTALFSKLGINIAKSNMSFGVSNNQIEYGTNNISGLFANKGNLLDHRFYRMLYEILKFNAKARSYVTAKPTATVADLVHDLKLSQYFLDNYLLAMAAAIWSSPKQQILKFPAINLINFFDNHGLLTVNCQPQWYTVNGGSKNYVNKIAQSLTGEIKLNTAVTAITRKQNKVLVTDSTGSVNEFDRVILACHSDQALKLITEPTEIEYNILSSISYQTNKIVVHKDPSFMPKNPKAWASWVYLGEQDNLSLTYWMNNLQPLNTTDNIFVTLNPSRMPKSEFIYDIHEFSHPLFDQAAISAQQQINKIQGTGGVYYCGAWLGYGFHEDGIKSAAELANLLGVDVPWK